MTAVNGVSLECAQASTARIYNYLLGGKDNYEVDREAAEQIIRSAPDAPAVARENLRFAGRAASWAVGAYGIKRVIDIGVGISHGVPIPSVETCVRQADPAVKVIAFDTDEVVLAHARAYRRGFGEVLHGDVTDLDGIFNHPAAADHIDTTRPMVVVLAAVLHFIEDAAAVMDGLRDRLAPGSVVVVSHATSSATSEDCVGGMTKAYEGASGQIIFRSEGEIRALAHGWNIVTPPGLVDVQQWSVDGGYRGELSETVRVVGMAARLPCPQGRGLVSGGAR